MQILVTVAFILPRLIWSIVKVTLVLLLLKHIFAVELTYSAFDHYDATISGVLRAISAFVSGNWLALSFVAMLYYSWFNSHTIKMMTKRIEQVEVIAFTQLNYFDFQPVRDIEREKKSKRSIIRILPNA